MGVAARLTNLANNYAFPIDTCAWPLVGLRAAHQASQQGYIQVQNLQGCHSAVPQQLVICWSWRWLHSVMLSCITEESVFSLSMLAVLLHALPSSSKRTTVLPVMQIKSTQQLPRATFMPGMAYH